MKEITVTRTAVNFHDTLPKWDNNLSINPYFNCPRNLSMAEYSKGEPGVDKFRVTSTESTAKKSSRWLLTCWNLLIRMWQS